MGGGAPKGGGGGPKGGGFGGGPPGPRVQLVGLVNALDTLVDKPVTLTLSPEDRAAIAAQLKGLSRSRIVPTSARASSVPDQSDPPDVRHQHVGRRRQQHPELVGHERVATRPVGEQLELLLLDPVLHLPAGTVPVLVQAPARPPPGWSPR